MSPTFSETDLETIWSALAFSAERHRSQRRKDAELSPYINHPIEVAGLLWRVGKVRDVNVLAAALLHDTAEDTQTPRPRRSKPSLGQTCAPW